MKTFLFFLLAFIVIACKPVTREEKAKLKQELENISEEISKPSEMELVGTTPDGGKIYFMWHMGHQVYVYEKRDGVPIAGSITTH